MRKLYKDNNEKDELVRYKYEYEPYMSRCIQIPLASIKSIYGDKIWE